MYSECIVVRGCIVAKCFIFQQKVPINLKREETYAEMFLFPVLALTPVLSLKRTWIRLLVTVTAIDLMAHAHQRARARICPFFPRTHENWVQHPMNARARTHVFPRMYTLVCMKHNTMGKAISGSRWRGGGARGSCPMACKQLSLEDTAAYISCFLGPLSEKHSSR